MTSTGTSTSVDCCGRVACVGGLAPGPPPSLDPPDRRREWSVAPPTPSIAVLPCLVAGLPLSRCCLACCIVVALVRFIAHGDSRPGDRVQCLSAPTGGGPGKSSTVVTAAAPQPPAFILVWSAFAVARRTSTLHGHRLCVAIHRLLRRADSSAGSHGTSPPPDQTVPGLARQHPGCCHWPSFRRTNVHSSRTLTLFVFFTQSRQI
jgi:hypothetical protein